MTRKLIPALMIILMVLSSCNSTQSEEPDTSALTTPVTAADMVVSPDRVSAPTIKAEGTKPGFGMMADNSAVTFSSSVDETPYLESVSSPDNPYTLYDEADLPSSYTFTDKPVTGTDGIVKITNDDGVSYNYIITNENLTSVTVSSDVPYMVTLSDVTINAEDTPALILKGDGKCFLNLRGTSKLSDTADNSKKGVITAESDLIITGDGSLSVTASKKHGLKIDGVLRILSGSITVTTTKTSDGNAISVDTHYIQDGGNVTIYATNDTYGSENKGIKVNGTEERESGKLVINGGRLTIESVDKGITAGWKLAEDAETETTDDDPDPSLYINNGVVTITTTGTIYEVSEDESLSPEGIEAKNDLVINGGLIQVSATDDALNAGALIEISGGMVFCQSRNADAADSNGEIRISGGTLIALGSDAPETGIDCDLSSNFTYTGGTVIAVSGGSNNSPESSETTGCVILENITGSSFALKDGDGNIIIAYAVPEGHSSASAVLIASDKITKGNTYTFMTDADIRGRKTFNGLIDASSVSGTSKTIEVTSNITGTSQDMMGRGGMMAHPEGFEMKGGHEGFRMAPSEGFDPSAMTPPEGFAPGRIPPENR
ncbi:MAG: carbohydrate-binding domain-containing protein [Bullifex sp.]|nr:carbohydrate-binding domain-containing protein [Bullifex sp.]